MCSTKQMVCDTRLERWVKKGGIHLLVFVSMEPQPGNYDPSSVWPVPSGLADRPQKSLWNMEAIVSKIGL